MSVGAFKRWATRLWSGLDRAVAEIEDHDALVTASLRELERTLKRARTRLEHMRAEGASLRERLASERRGARRWRTMAAAESEDVVAIECLRKARRADERGGRLEERIRGHAAAEDRAEQYVATLADRVGMSKRQHRVLRARSDAEVAASATAAGAVPIDDLFDRWESVLPYDEPVDDPTEAAFDVLERRYEDDALWAELEELRTGGNDAR